MWVKGLFTGWGSMGFLGMGFEDDYGAVRGNVFGVAKISTLPDRIKLNIKLDFKSKAKIS